MQTLATITTNGTYALTGDLPRDRAVSLMLAVTDGSNLQGGTLSLGYIRSDGTTFQALAAYGSLAPGDTVTTRWAGPLSLKLAGAGSSPAPSVVVDFTTVLG